MPDKNIPFDFIVNSITADGITTKFMFGMLYIYQGGRFMLMLRQRQNEPHLNGVWIVTTQAHHETLLKDLKGSQRFTEFGANSQWIFLPETTKNFETSALQLAGLINRGDKRLGRIVKNTRGSKPATKLRG
jgi:hypothetical protein